MLLASNGDHVRRRCTGVHHAGFEPSFALSVCLTDWWVSVDWKTVSVFHFFPPPSTFLPVRWSECFCLPFNFFLHASCSQIHILASFMLFGYLSFSAGESGLLAPLHTSTCFLSACAINLSVWLYPIFPYLPADILCFISFICGSHQTLAPDWFPCEQGCSGGPGTSSAGFEAPSHPVHCPQTPTPPSNTHPLPHLWVWEIGKHQNIPNILHCVGGKQTYFIQIWLFFCEGMSWWMYTTQTPTFTIWRVVAPGTLSTAPFFKALTDICVTALSQQSQVLFNWFLKPEIRSSENKGKKHHFFLWTAQLQLRCKYILINFNLT